MQYAHNVVAARGGKFPMANKLLADDLTAIGILRELTDNKRDRMFVFSEYLVLFQE